MPCVMLKTCYMEDVLETLELPPCNWLITGLECYDDQGWEDSEKWGEEKLFLSDAQLRYDVNLRNMPFIWGTFSAIPHHISKEEIEKHPLPETPTSYYMSSHIVPRHPQAILELYLEDGSDTYVASQDEALLKPLYRLPYKPIDAEAQNQLLNAQLRRIQDCLRRQVPEVSEKIANEVQWAVWHKIFRNKKTPISDFRLSFAVMTAYCREWRSPRKYSTPFWDPYLQK